MHYEPESLREIEIQFSKLRFRYQEILARAVYLGGKLKEERAKEFFRHGVGRRIEILHRSIDNIFRLFPPEQEEKLSQEDRIDVEINLHAFLINIYGIVENLALSLAYENDLIGDYRGEGRAQRLWRRIVRWGWWRKQQKVPEGQVNLFNKRFQRLLNPTLAQYLKQESIRNWYRNYAKNYRDALAHRIPPYVPPFTLNPTEAKRFAEIDTELQHLSYASDLPLIESLHEEQDRLGRPNPLFQHSFSENSRPVFLHGQVLNDFLTVEDLFTAVVTNFYLDHGIT
jgi:hypothetical protein